MKWFVEMFSFYGENVISTSPNPQAGGPPLVGCPRLLIQYIRRYLPYWRPFLHPQPEDGPYRGDRDQLIYHGNGARVILNLSVLFSVRDIKQRRHSSAEHTMV